MYFDLTKFNYSDFDVDNEEQLIERDKNAFKYSLTKWVDENLDKIADRKWEIDSIGIIEKTSDFIKLIHEAEFSYSIGLFISSISLIGIAAEDLCKYFARISNQSDLIEVSQHRRINALHNRSFLSDELKARFEYIRDTRNNCLHFDDDFKVKESTELKIDALKSINNLKNIYSELFKTYNESNSSFNEKLTQIIESYAHNSSDSAATLNADEFTMKIRNFFAKELKIDVAISDPNTVITRSGVFSVYDVDFEYPPKEITLIDYMNPIVPVIIDVSDEEIQAYNLTNLRVGERIAATIRSITNHVGITAEWRFIQLKSLS